MRAAGPPAVLVDSDVASFALRRDSRARLYERHLQGVAAAVSFMTVAELRLLPLQNDWGERRRAELEAHLARYAVLESDDDLCRWWARVRDEAFRRARPISPSDAWIAATALMNQIPLVTHNARHFANIPGLTLITEGP